MRSSASSKDIRDVLVALETLWLRHPHQRLGQLLLNLARNPGGAVDAGILWNLDEPTLLKCIRECDWSYPFPAPEETE